MGDDENACVRNIVKEIIRESNYKKIKVNKNFVTYLTKLLLMDPNWGIGDDFFTQRQNVQLFVKYMIEEMLSKQDMARLVTLQIQFYFSCNLEYMDYTIENNKKDFKNKLLILRDDITATKVGSKDVLDYLFRKMVYYITLLTGLGNPAKHKVYEEASIAFKSIFDGDDLLNFIALPKAEKHIQLNQFSKIVGGIRLFNKDCEKGGEGIVNLPELVTDAINVIKSGSEESLLTIMKTVNLLTTVMDKCYTANTYARHQTKLVLSNETSKSNVDIDEIKDLLIYFRQYELTIRRVLEELDRIYDKTPIINENMEMLLKKIHDTVYMKIAIPVGAVFPLFEQLWDIWEQFQNQALLLSRLSVIMGNLEAYRRQIHMKNVNIDQIVGDTVPMTDAERLAETAHLTLFSSGNHDIRVIRSDTIKNIDNIDLEYLGFCCWSLIETNGALIPGNPSMGIVVYKGRNYVFSSVEAFEEFSKDPLMYVNSVLDLARKKPQLINFFQLKDDLENAYSIKKLVHSKVEIKMCEDKFIQTVSDMEEPHIDPRYRWNIWDLKKEALTMANINSAVTVSTQTDKTSSKNSMRTQTYYRKNLEVQTTRDTYTNMPKPSVFVYGLRGRKDNEQFKIDLTRPVEER